MVFRFGLVASAFLVCCFRGELFAQDWTQFRGPNAVGVAPDSVKLPTQIGPESNVVWKIDLPPGHSSPIVVHDHIYVTAVRDKTCTPR